MAITVAWYGLSMLKIAQGTLDIDALSSKLTLHTSSYTPNLDTHDFRDDLTNEVANGNGYTTGGAALGSPAWTYDATSHEVRLDFADVSWTFTGSKTWRYGVCQVVRGGASSADEIFALLTWDSDQTVSTSYTLQFASQGLLYIDCG